jgi:photosystem II stability/assembly factor-like uncharacterized protein
VNQNIVLKIDLSILMIPIIALAGWSSQPSGTTVHLKDVDFVDNNHGWVVGGQAYGAPGIILFTPDGGTSWVDQTPNLPEGIDVLDGVSFVDINTGWAAGDDTLRCSLILKTTNGGITWFRQTTPIDTPGVVSVHFLDTNNGWMSHGGPYGPSYQQVILHTVNGGSSYSTQGWSNYDGGTCRLFFSDLQHGWVAGGTEMTPTTRGYIMHTTNGGASWTESYHWGATIPWTWPLMTAVHFPVDNTNGWACGWLAASPANYKMRIVHTANGGNNWSIQFSADTSVSPPLDIHFVDLQNGWVVCFDGQILHTTDGGTTWQFDPTGVNADLYGVDFVNLSDGWAVGNNGTILKYSEEPGIEEKTVALATDFDLSLMLRRNEIMFSILSLKAGKLTLSLYNTLGQKILFGKKHVPSGISYHRLSGSDNLSCGVYFLKAELFDKSIVKKFTLIK